MNILEELKLSKKQNNDKRYDYLCEQFNVVNYAIKLEKYTIKLQQENKILKENAEHNDKVVDKVNWENMLLKKENKQLKEEKRKVRDYINKHCVNEKISKEVGYKCYTMADTNELEKIMKILGDKE